MLKKVIQGNIFRWQKSSVTFIFQLDAFERDFVINVRREHSVAQKGSKCFSCLFSCPHLSVDQHPQLILLIDISIGTQSIF